MAEAYIHQEAFTPIAVEVMLENGIGPEQAGRDPSHHQGP